MSSSLFTIKGAPDILIDRCSQIVGADGFVKPLSRVMRLAVKELKDQWSAAGKRVILLARKMITQKDLRFPPSANEFESAAIEHAKENLVLVGLVGIVDPPREEIPGVVRTLRMAGIRIFMVRLFRFRAIVRLIPLTLPGYGRFCPYSAVHRPSVRYRHSRRRNTWRRTSLPAQLQVSR
jgi:hypothetical protein